MHPWVGSSDHVRLGGVARWVTPEPRSKRGRLPQKETVRVFLAARGVDGPTVIAEWVHAWRRLTVSTPR